MFFVVISSDWNTFEVGKTVGIENKNIWSLGVIETSLNEIYIAGFMEIP